MACATHLHVTDCVLDHWAPALGLRKERSGWRGPCPHCGSPRAIEVSIRGARIVRNVHCECGTARVDPLLAERVGACFPVRASARTRRKDLISRAELESLIGLHGAALELRVACLAWDCSPKDAAAKLGMPARTLRWAVSQVPR